jgi:hypothetical protein
MTADELLAEARRGLTRLDPAAAVAAVAAGAVLVDIRSAPVCDTARQLIVMCDEGYQSSLAAANLQRLGLEAATDLAGGFQAWRAAGLPVEPGLTTP